MRRGSDNRPGDEKADGCADAGQRAPGTSSVTPFNGEDGSLPLGRVKASTACLEGSMKYTPRPPSLRLIRRGCRPRGSAWMGTPPLHEPGEDCVELAPPRRGTRSAARLMSVSMVAESRVTPFAVVTGGRSRLARRPPAQRFRLRK